MRPLDRPTYALLLALTALVYFLGLFFPLLDPDANEYASIALRMVQRNDFVNLISRNHQTLQEFDYLDKPHLHFWLAALSFKIFGVSEWAYRLPSVLFSVLGTYSVYRLGALLYQREVGKMAALIYATSLAIILFNHDVRTDTILTSAVAFGLWQLAAFVQNRHWTNVALGCMGIALGVASKGMIAVVLAGTALFCHIAYLRAWKVLFNPKWLIGLAAFLLTLSPVLYCYYLQFDLHPEKLVNGGYGRSGIRFLFWTQSFERLAGTRHAQSSPEFSFFYHTLLWAMLPWSVLVYAAVFDRLKKLWNLRLQRGPQVELLTLGGALLVFHLMSFSQFKLPHYLNILFPLFAVLLASYLYQLHQKDQEPVLKRALYLQYFIVGVLLLLTGLVNLWAFPVTEAWVAIGGLLLLALLVLAFIRLRGMLNRLLGLSALGILLLAFFLNTNFYPQLMRYQSGNQLARFVKQQQLNPRSIFLYRHFSYSIDFYLQQTTPALTDTELVQKAGSGLPFYLVVYAEDLPQLQQSGLQFRPAHRFLHTNVSRLDGRFLNPATRAQRLTELYLMRMN